MLTLAGLFDLETAIWEASCESLVRSIGGNAVTANTMKTR